MLAIDLFVVGGGKAHCVSMREAATWSAIWIAIAFLFAGALWWHVDNTAGRAVANETTLEFITGYLIEKSLAVDNVFVWLMLFSFFAIPMELQKRVLMYGVIGAIVMRTIMIFAGVWLIAKFHWLLYLFGAFLLVTGVKMWIFAEHKPDLAQNPVVKWIRGHMNVTDELHGERFFVMKRESGRWVRYVTPLFIVLTSNVFAILGLRATYFLLADMAERFSLLKYGLAIVLMVVGVKMMLIDVFKIPVGISLAIIGAVITASVVLSLRRQTPRG